jgi:monoterpene epsilon-lactone hydrolase
MASIEAKAELTRLFADRKPDRPLDVRRREWEAEARLLVLPKESRFSRVTVGDVVCEWMEMPRVDKDRVMLFLHGGGYNAGSPRTHRQLAAHLSRATHMRLLMPEYRLAPEHPFPAAVKDALQVYGWLQTQGFSPGQIVVGGDSAGGGLTLSMLLALREAGAAMPAAAILLAPWTDLTVSSPSYRSNRKFDPIITQDGLREAGLWYAGERNPADPMMSPLFADLRGLPPMLIHAASDETMVDDSRLLAERARAAGVEVTCRIYDGLWHVFHAAGIEIPESRQAIDEIGTYLRGLKGE